MPDRSEDSIEQELRELEAEVAADADEAASDADREEPGSGAASDGADAAGSIGLDQDPSDQYSDLLDDAPDATAGSDGATATEATAAESTESADASNSADGGGLLGRLFGRGPDSEPAAETSGTTAETSSATVEDSDSRLSGLRGHFSLRAVLAAAIAMAVLGGIGRTFVPLVGGPFGLWLGAFLVGIASAEGRYLECAVAGALVGALGALAGGVSVAIAADATRRLLAVGGVVGLVLALVGQYFGNDLRAGLADVGDVSGPEP